MDDSGTELEVLDVEVEDVPGTDLAVRGGADVEASDVVDGEIIEEQDSDELVLEGYGVAYQPHGPVSSDVSSAAITGNGTSGGGFHWTKPERGGGGAPGGGGTKPKRKRRGQGSGSGGGGGFHFSLFGGLFTGASVVKTGAIASNNANPVVGGLLGKRPPARRRPR